MQFIWRKIQGAYKQLEAKRFQFNSKNGFTLVELIIVIFIISILSSIAIPSFQDIGKKARQRGVAAQLSTYLKAAQAFYTEYSSPVRYAEDLGNYVSVLECRYHLMRICKGDAVNHRNVAVEGPTSTVWNSTSGVYTLRMSNSNDDRFLIRALPQRQDSEASILSDDDYGVSACYNYSTQTTKMILWSEKGHSEVEEIDC